MSIYQIDVTKNNGEKINLSDYQDKVLLIVNTASNCGFTHQYKGLEELAQKYQDQLAILAFPCNQFGSQEPGTDSEIKEFCDLQFNITFPLFAKVDVNGNDTHELFKYLKKELPGLMGSQKIKWNFTKFLIDKSGNPIERFAPQTKPQDLTKHIDQLI